MGSEQVKVWVCGRDEARGGPADAGVEGLITVSRLQVVAAQFAATAPN